MTDRAATAHFHFAVSGLNVEPELLGVTVPVNHGDYVVRLTLPASDTDFGVSAARNHFLSVLGGGVQQPEGHWIQRSVLMVRASVDINLPLSPMDFNPTHVALTKAADAARSVLSDYLETVRAKHGQHWLGIGVRDPRTAWLTFVVDRNTGEDLHVGYQDPLKVVGGFSRALTLADHMQALEAAEHGDHPQLPELLLADAKFLGWISDPPQLREALLLAAVACEVKIKQQLRDVCPPESKALLDYAIDNPREVTQQAAGLFHKAAQAVTGRSLHTENPALWNGLQNLFVTRNQVAHKGADVTAVKLREYLLTASEALAWAESLTVKS